MKEYNQENIFEFETPPLPDLSGYSNSVFSETEKPRNADEKFIIFTLAETQYAVASNSVSEVIRQLNLTPVHNVPEWFLGIANLRGDIISVVDLHILWKQEISTPYTAKTKLIVMRCKNPDFLVAFKVDKLCEVITLSNEAIQPLKDNYSSFLSGQAKHKSGIINLLDVKEILCSLKII